MSHSRGTGWRTCSACGEKQQVSLGQWVTCRNCGIRFHTGR